MRENHEENRIGKYTLVNGRGYAVRCPKYNESNRLIRCASDLVNIKTTYFLSKKFSTLRLFEYRLAEQTVRKLKYNNVDKYYSDLWTFKNERMFIVFATISQEYRWLWKVQQRNTWESMYMFKSAAWQKTVPVFHRFHQQVLRYLNIYFLNFAKTNFKQSWKYS